MKNITFVLASSIFTLILAFGCAEAGDDGDAGIDCGDYGSAHDGHCHCEEGYAFDGETCVALDSISIVCESHDEHADDTEAHTDDDDTDTHDDESEHENEHEHAHEACICGGEAADCECDGELVTQGGSSYCLPELHGEE